MVEENNKKEYQSFKDLSEQNRYKRKWQERTPFIHCEMAMEIGSNPMGNGNEKGSCSDEKACF